jgi:hypothetical protein
VEKLCEYMAFKSTYEHAGPKEEIPEFTERIPPEIALELYATMPFVLWISTNASFTACSLVAADYLEGRSMQSPPSAVSDNIPRHSSLRRFR